MTRIAVYYRVSTDKQTLDMQRHAVGVYIAAHHPGEPVTEYIDQGKSGKDLNRMEFLRLVADAEKKAFDVVICYKLDRIARMAGRAIQTILRFEELDIAFVATSQPILNLGPGVPFRKMILAAFAELAQMEHDMIMERNAASREARAHLYPRAGTVPCISQNLDKVASIAEMVALGMTIKQIAVACGHSSSVVHKYLKGIGLRPQQQNVGPKYAWQDSHVRLAGSPPAGSTTESESIPPLKR